eukprot:m.745585 g.745585  ORF g.745585 m.745585 type:complete len:377 (-) comp58957_c1_seq1:83-1213(-)
MANHAQDTWSAFEVDRTTWHLPEQCYLSAPPPTILGKGSYGQVCAVRLTVPVENPPIALVAIKRHINAFDHREIAKRTHRELYILWRFAQDDQSEDIIRLLDCFVHHPPELEFPTIYMVTELHVPRTRLRYPNLHGFCRAQQLNGEQVRYIIYQILRGLKYMHSAGVVHRDLKPSNIAINDELKIKIIDMGLARVVPDQDQGDNTVYVQTRWYRAPEVILEAAYDERMDVWSVGCIMAEIISQTVLLEGRDSPDQMLRIIQLCGFPPQSLIDRIQSDAIRQFLAPFAAEERRDIPHPDPLARRVLNALLSYERRTAAEALELPYFQFEGGHNPALEPIYGGEPIIDFEGGRIVEEWRDMILALVEEMRPDLLLAHH